MKIRAGTKNVNFFIYENMSSHFCEKERKFAFCENKSARQFVPNYFSSQV